jgi:hypothetical protein
MKIIATTAFAEAFDPLIVKRAEQIVQMTKTHSIPEVAIKKSFLRPILSTKKQEPVATIMFVIWRMPLMRSWVVESVIPIWSKTV